MKQLGGQEVRELENRKKSFNSRVFDTLQNNINRILKKFFFLFDVFFLKFGLLWFLLIYLKSLL